ncbi:MAG: FtsK/SpoIIIE domain-containing protein, partial [Actinomycetota bacterium]
MLVDYKGGSAFDGCAPLPHVATVVTDLDGSRTDRVLHGVDAELRRREHWLRDHGREDLAAAAGVEGRPARLVVAVDEFATLARDRPDVLGTLVDVARRGRSLGLHLVLATQRPAGAMTDEIRANTELRIALRMADGSDSTDVVGTSDAARLPADRPGLAIVRTGRDLARVRIGRVTAPEPPRVGLRVVPPGPSGTDRSSRADDHPAGPTALQLVVKAATELVSRSEWAEASGLWPPDLPESVSAEELDRPSRRHGVAIGVVDDLTATAHQVCGWTPADGLLALHGADEAELVTVVGGVLVALARHASPVHIHVLDGGDRCGPWGDAAPVAAVVPGRDRPGVRRLLDRLEARPIEPAPVGPTIVLVLQDHPAIVRALDDLDGLRLLERLHGAVLDGGRGGDITIVTAGRPAQL